MSYRMCSDSDRHRKPLGKHACPAALQAAALYVAAAPRRTAAAPALQEHFLNMRRLCADSCPTTTFGGCFFPVILEHIENCSLQK